MTPEEMQKTMHFIIGQRAQLVVNQRKADERMTRMEGVVLRLANVTEQRINELAAAQKGTEGRLNASIDTAERIINERRDGKA